MEGSGKGRLRFRHGPHRKPLGRRSDPTPWLWLFPEFAAFSKSGLAGGFDGGSPS